LSEQLGFLQITEEASSEYEQIDTEMSAKPAPAPAPANENVQAVMPNVMGCFGQESFLFSFSFIF